MGLAQAATVYCPGDTSNNSTLTAPTSGRYVQVTNGADPGKCYYTDGNLDKQVSTTSGNMAYYSALGFNLLDKNGSPGTLLLGSSFTSGATSGNWNLATNIWSSYTNLYLGFHFGNGGGSPDSFVVQLQKNAVTGTWALLTATASMKLNGLSNIYLFTTDGGPPPARIPEPGTLALAGLALAGIGLARRRKV